MLILIIPAIRKSLLSKTLFILFFIMSFLISSPLVDNFCCAHFFASITPLYFLLLSAVISAFYRFLSGHKLLKYICLALLIVSFYSLSGDFTSYSSNYRNSKIKANIIANDLIQIKKDNNFQTWDFFRVNYFIDYHSDANLEILYFLEEKFGTKIISIITNKIVQTNNYHYVYLLCMKRTHKDCLTWFNESYNQEKYTRFIIWQDTLHILYRYNKIYRI